jgi:hypothetical protein
MSRGMLLGFRRIKAQERSNKNIKLQEPTFTRSMQLCSISIIM